MDKRIFICIITILVIFTLAVLFFHFFEIVKEISPVPPIREYYNNDYLALERWLNETGFTVTRLKEYEFNIENETDNQKTVLLTRYGNIFYDATEEDIIKWIKNGSNVIMCLNAMDIKNLHEKLISLLMQMGITIDTTPEYYTYSTEETPDYHWRYKFTALDYLDYVFYYDIHNNIRIVKIQLGDGTLTIMGTPIFMWNSNIGKEANARLTWELLTLEKKEIVIVQNYSGPQERKTLFGTLMQRGNIIPVIISAFLLICFGFWCVIPVFGKLSEEKQRYSRPIKDRFAAEIGFLKKYKGLYYYNEAINKIGSKK